MAGTAPPPAGSLIDGDDPPQAVISKRSASNDLRRTIMIVVRRLDGQFTRHNDERIRPKSVARRRVSMSAHGVVAITFVTLGRFGDATNRLSHFVILMTILRDSRHHDRLAVGCESRSFIQHHFV
jgi:hypothetical protein